MIRFIVSLFVMLNGCNATKISSIQDNSQPQATAIEQQSVEQERGFQSVLSGRAKTADGTPFSFNSYKSPDGTMVSTRFERRKSPAQANKELIRKIKEAVEVIERMPKLDEDGRQVGERALFTFKQEASTNLRTTVVWTVGSQIYFIESYSLQHALEFEKWYLHNL
ncbi:MAG: hypothetical protein WKF90_04580 [Pyrinomonadaceae bacterium]